MELSGINTSCDPRRVKSDSRGVPLSIWATGRKGEDHRAWVGMRPMLPDGLPAIGRAPGCENLFIAAGHTMLGITSARRRRWPSPS